MIIIIFIIIFFDYFLFCWKLHNFVCCLVIRNWAFSRCRRWKKYLKCTWCQKYISIIISMHSFFAEIALLWCAISSDFRCARKKGYCTPGLADPSPLWKKSREFSYFFSYIASFTHAYRFLNKSITCQTLSPSNIRPYTLMHLTFLIYYDYDPPYSA